MELSDLWMKPSSLDEKKILQSDQLHALLQAMPTGVVILDSNGIIIEANQNAVGFLGEPLHKERWINVIARSFAPRADDGHEVSLIDGRRVKVSMTALADHKGEIIVLTDLTQTRRLQQHLSQMQRLSALGEMMATLAHQVRTPLSAALLYASHLSNDKLSQSARKKFQSKLMCRLNEIEFQVSDLLMFAKDEKLSLKLIQLNDVVSHAFDVVEPIASRFGCQIQVENLQEAQIKGHKNALTSVIDNLLMNAIEADATLISMRLKDNVSWFELTIEDDGKGFESSLEKKIIEPFYTSKSHGTGLGLPIVKKVLRQHQGQLSITSEDRQGCLVMIRLPKIIEQEADHDT